MTHINFWIREKALVNAQFLQTASYPFFWSLHTYYVYKFSSFEQHEKFRCFSKLRSLKTGCL